MTINDYSLHLCREYSRIIKKDISEDIMLYLLSFENSEDLKEYVIEVVDETKIGFQDFFDILLQCWKECHQISSPKILDQKHILNMDEDSPNKPIKKKSTFSPLFGSDGKEKLIAKLPGRHVCDCQAHKHPLINNCLKCGRVVCDQEGSGPCLFCGSLVCTKEEQEILSRNSKKSERLRSLLMAKYSKVEDEQEMVGLDKALLHKDRLLEYDRTSAKRTQVIDDESDYFATDNNQWLSEKQRIAIKKKEEELRSIRFASRKDRKITLDFAGRQVIEEDPHNVHVYKEEFNDLGFSNLPENNSNFNDLQTAHIDSLKMQPTFVACDAYDAYLLAKDKPKGKSSVTESHHHMPDGHINLRIQDSQLQQMADNGMALSMHQPWASLLVAGIKKHEGRSWYSNHRGVLWIASTSKQPNIEEIQAMQDFYTNFYNDSTINFPKAYPASCLLGRVEVVDCIAAEDYKNQYPDGESDSPYVFICDNATELKMKFPMKGKHKIYKLEPSLLKGAKQAISWI